MRGRRPAETHTRARNDKETIKLVSDGRQRGFALPQLRIDGRVKAWHPETVKWWNSWRKSPQAVRMMTEPDWRYLLVTARIHHEFWSTGDMAIASELRLREQKFGATPEDRSRLRVEIGTGLPSPEQAKTAPAAAKSNVADMDAERRARVVAQG